MKPRARTTPGTDRFVRPDLRDMAPYQAIVAPGTLEGDAFGPDGAIVKLDGNENVYGCSPRVQRALASFQGFHIYPDPQQRELRQALAGYAGLGAEYILAGAGSDEIIDLLLRLILSPGERITVCPPTFGMYALGARLCGGRPLEVPRDAAFSVDAQAVLRAAAPGAKAIFIDTPGNPTGVLTPREDLLRLLDADALVVVDEAYYEFGGQTVANLVPENENLVVLRTFSKWAGLAGLRLGYGMMAPSLVRRLLAIRPPYSISAAAHLAALESLADIDYLRGAVKAIVQERDRLFQALRSVAFLKPLPSHANFILCRVEGRDAKAIQAGLRRRGIYIRHFATPRLNDYIRISVGTPEHTDAVVQALRAWEEQG